MWELRNCRVNKRGRFYLAAAGRNQLVAEFTLADCIAVGRKDAAGVWQPFTADPIDEANFFLRPDNLAKHGVRDVNALASYEVLFAWVLEDVQAFAEPVSWEPKRGAIKFCTVTLSSKARKQMKGMNDSEASAPAAPATSVGRKRPAAAMEPDDGPPPGDVPRPVAEPGGADYWVREGEFPPTNACAAPHRHLHARSWRSILARPGFGRLADDERAPELSRGPRRVDRFAMVHA